VKKVFISLGIDGLYYCDSNIKGFLPIYKTQAKNTNGAGDIFMSAIILAEASGLSIDEQSMFGVVASSINVESSDTISRNLNLDVLKERVEEYKCINNI